MESFPLLLTTVIFYIPGSEVPLNTPLASDIQQATGGVSDIIPHNDPLRSLVREVLQKVCNQLFEDLADRVMSEDISGGMQELGIKDTSVIVSDSAVEPIQKGIVTGDSTVASSSAPQEIITPKEIEIGISAEPHTLASLEKVSK